jgi:hypothetical protein
MRRSSCWRIARAAAISLLAGAVVNVAVAWGIAAWMPLRATSHKVALTSRGFNPGMLVPYSGLGWCTREWETTPPPGTDAIFMWPSGVESANEPGDVIVDNHEIRADWGHGFQYVSGDPAADYDSVERAVGWPCLALWCGLDASSARGYAMLGGIELRTWPSWLRWVRPKPERYLPYRPIWGGILVNTAGFALATLCMVVGLSRIRRGPRRCRGLCPSCSYSLAGLPFPTCPECGWKPRNRGDSAEHNAGGA